MKVLAACEESQAVAAAFRRLGHEAYSCDVEPCSGGHPEWHIQQDVLPLLDGRCRFRTADGRQHAVDGEWDMILAFPPCTHLAVSGARYFKEKRRDGRQQRGIDFFLRFVRADCGRVAIENPVGIMSTVYRRPDQIIQPYEYGHAERKRTCLWLKGLPPLVPTRVVRPELHICANGLADSRWHYDTYSLPLFPYTTLFRSTIHTACRQRGGQRNGQKRSQALRRPWRNSGGCSLGCGGNV